jgi:ribonuclease HI
MSKIIIFTDGAVPSNQLKIIKKGGVGVFFGKDDERNISFSVQETKNQKVTNQVCETMACIMALETLVSTQKIGNKEIIICTDSMYLVNSIMEWADGWNKNNWKKADGKLVQNLDLIKKLYYLSKNLKVTYQHVKAHRKAPPIDSDEYFEYYGNYMADKLASNAAKIV